MYDTDDALADVTQSTVVGTLFLTIVIKFIGCPSWFNYVFASMALTVVLHAIAMILKDTAEERTFLYMHGRSMIVEIVHFIRKREHMRGGAVHQYALQTETLPAFV